MPPPTLPTGLIRQVLPIVLMSIGLFLSSPIASAQTLRICAYNILDRPTTAVQDANMRIVLEAIGNVDIFGNAQPIDVLAFQEGPENAAEYADIEVNFELVFGGNYESTFSPADFAGCRTGFIYNADKLQMLGSANLTSGLTHNTRRTRFRPFDGTADDEFYIYSLHLNAGNEDEDSRTIEAGIIRANAELLPETANIIYAGDFNMRGSIEGAYQAFVSPGANASAIDSLNTPFGFRDNIEWKDNLAFQPFHTQDPTSSVDDRFDAILFNQNLLNGQGLEYVKGSASVLGNNGSHTLNSNINTGNGAAGFASALVAFSDHLPVITDFTYDQIPPEPAINVTRDAILTRTVQSTGPVTGSAGDTNFNIEGTNNGVFASFGVVDFDLTDLIGKQETVTGVRDVVLQVRQNNAGFTRDGPVSIYVASSTAANIEIDGSIQFQTGNNELASIPTPLSTNAEKAATYAAVHRSISGGLLAPGTVDQVGLFGASLEQAIIDAANGSGTLRLLVTPDESATASTFTGFSSTLGVPQLSMEIVSDNGETEVFANQFSINLGSQGPGNLSGFQDSDDQYVRFSTNNFPTASVPDIQVVFTGTIPLAEFQSISTVVETRCNTPGVEQSVELFNFINGTWELIDTSTVELADVTFDIVASGDPTRFVAGGTILARVSWEATGLVLFSPWSIDVDQFKWSVDP